MKTTSLLAGASRFAHFAGLTRSAARQAADDETDRDDNAADDERDPDASEDDEDQPEGKKGKNGKRGRAARSAEDDERDPDAEDDDTDPDASDDDEDEPEGKKGRKARRADDDDDDKQEMSGRSAVAAARRRERARCAAILSSPHAAHNPALAASLACDTTMTRKEAIAVLSSQAGRSNDRAPERSSRESRNSDLGASGPAPKGPVGSSWDRSLAKLGIAPRKA
jgi:hypothetical protein